MYLDEELLDNRIYTSGVILAISTFASMMCWFSLLNICSFFLPTDFINLSFESVNFYGP